MGKSAFNLLVDRCAKKDVQLKDAEKILNKIQPNSNPAYLVKLIEEYKEKYGDN